MIREERDFWHVYTVQRVINLNVIFRNINDDDGNKIQGKLV